MWPVVQFYFSSMSSPSPVSVSIWSKFCLFATGGIYVKQSFTNAGGEIQISGSSAKLLGGAVLRSSFGSLAGF